MPVGSSVPLPPATAPPAAHEEHTVLVPMSDVLRIRAVRRLRATLNQMLLGQRRLQPFYIAMHRLALAGMNFGPCDPTVNGEMRALEDWVRVHAAADPPVLFDVGASTGHWAQTVLDRLSGRVRLICCEPSPTAFVELSRALADRPQVRLLNVGLGANEHDVPLYADRPGSELGSVFNRHMGHYDVKLVPGESIRLRRLDAICADESIEHIDYLKLDIEGNEYDALLGAGELLTDRRIKAIQFEFGGTDVDARVFFRDFFELLNPDYAINRILRDGLWPIERYHEADEIFTYNNFLCLVRS